MQVYVVYEEDRGIGVSVVGVYTDLAVAEEVAAQSSGFFVLGPVELDAPAE
jgi:hypothetical protein